MRDLVSLDWHLQKREIGGIFKFRADNSPAVPSSRVVGRRRGGWERSVA